MGAYHTMYVCSVSSEVVPFKPKKPGSICRTAVASFLFFTEYYIEQRFESPQIFWPKGTKLKSPKSSIAIMAHLSPPTHPPRGIA